MRNFSIFLSIIVLFFINGASADSKITSVDSFREFSKIVNSLGSKNLPHTLVVMDDDDTLTMMSCPVQDDIDKCQYLGGPAWFSWQDELLDTNSSYKVANSFNDLLNISTLLFSMNDMVYTEKEIPNILQDFTQSGVKLLVLTARGTDTMSATSSQFLNLEVPLKDSQNSSFLELISNNALKGNKSDISSIASPFIPKSYKVTRPVSYQQGIMFVSGQNKGEMLKSFLSKTQSSNIKNIFFIDDTMKNVQDVNDVFSKSSVYNVNAIHYVALEKHKLELTQGVNASKYQNRANERWNSIKAVMTKELQIPAGF